MTHDSVLCHVICIVPRLRGCIPLTPYTTVTYAGTQLTGWCSDNKEDIEQQQFKAMHAIMPSLVDANAKKWAAVDFLFRDLRGSLSQLWVDYGALEVYSFICSDDRGSITLELKLVNNVIYITTIDIVGAALNLAVLPALVAQLPKLEVFVCYECHYNSKDATAMQLPAALAGKAPQTLWKFIIDGSRLQGTLPKEWGTWSTLKHLSLTDNVISGPLPATWKDMSSLTYLDLQQNLLQGSLPPEWGSGGMSKITKLVLRHNSGLVGSVPAEWGTFSGGVLIHNTNITGCVPDQLMTNIFGDQPNVPCSQDSVEVSSLLALRKYLDPTGLVLSSWDRNSSGPADKPGELVQYPPTTFSRMCNVTCDVTNRCIVRVWCAASTAAQYWACVHYVH